MDNIGKGIAVAAIWIVCGIYANKKGNSDALWGAAVLTLILF
jgi:hypothetical protein